VDEMTGIVYEIFFEAAEDLSFKCHIQPNMDYQTPKMPNAYRIESNRYKKRNWN
jgi:hypothetical protein